MHNDFIGDSLDAAKLVLLKALTSYGISACLVPLPSHNNFDYERYTRCVAPSCPAWIYRSQGNYIYCNQSRNHYFDELSNWLTTKGISTQVVLFDPDTGIRSDRDTNKFLGVQRMTRFLQRHPHCVIGVYQHRGTGGLTIDSSLELIQTDSRFAYDFGGASILFWAEKPAKTTFERVRQILLESFNENRIRPDVNSL